MSRPVDATEDDLRWLWWAVESAPVWATEDAPLLAALENLFEDQDAQDLLKEMTRRLDVWGNAQHEMIAAILTRLHASHGLAGQHAQLVDRTMLRLLPHLRGATARGLARTCLSSNRLLRRRGAWRHFTRQGSKSETTKILKDARPEKDKAFLEWLIVEPRLARFVELDVLLPQIASFYWRARVLETAVQSNRDEVVRIADLYPTETLAAIRWSHSRRDIALARDLLRRHGDDVRVLTEAIRVFAEFRAIPDLARGLAIGRDILRRDPIYSQLVP